MCPGGYILLVHTSGLPASIWEHSSCTHTLEQLHNPTGIRGVTVYISKTYIPTPGTQTHKGTYTQDHEVEWSELPNRCSRHRAMWGRKRKLMLTQTTSYRSRTHNKIGHTAYTLQETSFMPRAPQVQSPALPKHDCRGRGVSK